MNARVSGSISVPLSVFPAASMDWSFSRAAYDPIVVDLVSGLFSQCQTIDHVRGHERIAGVVGPPTPAAVLVLERVQPIAPAFYFFFNSLSLRIVADLNSLSVFVTMMFGRKLDIVCSTQPYGYVVR